MFCGLCWGIPCTDTYPLIVQTMAPTVMWFRRDLRVLDNPALTVAAQVADRSGEGVVPVFVLDDTLLRPAGDPRRAFLLRCLRTLDEDLHGRLVVRHGRPASVVPAVAAEVGAEAVWAAADFGPYGARRDRAVAAALADAGRSLESVGSPYAVPPGTVVKRDGSPYRVFTPFYRAWRAAGWPPPDGERARVRWTSGVASDALPAEPAVDAVLPEAGETAAARRLEHFLEAVGSYGEQRDRPDLDGTSRLSPYLKYGCLHPRQVLSRLGRSEGAEVFRVELAWREFYADVLFHDPASARRSMQPAMRSLRVDDDACADRRFAAWASGRTGYPIVDAGMRQLLGEGWVHNRVRMIVASFLVKDLHVDWRRGARWFMRHLVDGDLASNNHGWQWVAGTGTDPAPYFRIFNPVTQGRKFDPHGAYIRRWVPELAKLGPADIHEPWARSKATSPPFPSAYPAPIVDHAMERTDALIRYGEIKG
ncbi:MAG: deoxyribodipyrimidine photo-lyase [Acidimicrobiaceae bacterium]|nr:deoxyribodipyrimidine photo-lyase [Acidimicrobiaceae bacterium]